MDSRLRGNDGKRAVDVIPAKAGIHLIASPLMLPIVKDLGVDSIQSAAIIGVNPGMGNITPPAAPLLYLGARIGNTSVSSMPTPTLMMILFAWIPTLLLTTCIPDVALRFPGLVYGR